MIRNRLMACVCLLILAAILLVSLILEPPVTVVEDTRTRQTTLSSQQDVLSVVSEPVPAEPELVLDLHLCRNAPDYACQEPAYDNFTDRMLQYALAQNSTTWGRRRYPLPANSSVFILGNSHTRQVYSTLLCQYNDSLVHSSLQQPRYYNDSYRDTELFGRTTSWQFGNNATLTVVANSLLTHCGSQWIPVMERILQRPLSSFSAIVMGRFNEIDLQTSFGREIIDFANGSSGVLFDDAFTRPTVEHLAESYSGPIVVLPMFAKYGQDIRLEAEQVMEQWRVKENRTNIRLVNGRQHIDLLGECSAYDRRRTNNVCLNVGSGRVANARRDPVEMHRCSGKHGGHPDLTAWDLIERLQELLG